MAFTEGIVGFFEQARRIVSTAEAYLHGCEPERMAAKMDGLVAGKHSYPIPPFLTSYDQEHFMAMNVLVEQYEQADPQRACDWHDHMAVMLSSMKGAAEEGSESHILLTGYEARIARTMARANAEINDPLAHCSCSDPYVLQGQ